MDRRTIELHFFQTIYVITFISFLKRRTRAYMHISNNYIAKLLEKNMCEMHKTISIMLISLRTICVYLPPFWKDKSMFACMKEWFLCTWSLGKRNVFLHVRFSFLPLERNIYFACKMNNCHNYYVSFFWNKIMYLHARFVLAYFWKEYTFTCEKW